MPLPQPVIDREDGGDAEWGLPRVQAAIETGYVRHSRFHPPGLGLRGPNRIARLVGARVQTKHGESSNQCAFTWIENGQPPRLRP